MLLGNLPQCQHDVLHGLAVVLPPVAGDEDDFLLPVGQAVQFIRGEHIVLPDGGLQRVDDGIAGDEQSVGDTLFQEVTFVVHCRAEVQVRDGGHQLPVHLLREGGIFVIGPQSRLHVAHRHLMVEGGQRSGKSGGGIAVDQDHVRLQGFNGLIHAGEALAGDGGQGLAGGHDVQVPVGLQIKDLQHAVQHLTVLGGDAAQALNLRPGGQFLYQGTHFDGFRPGAENAQDTQLFHVLMPLKCLIYWRPHPDGSDAFSILRPTCFQSNCGSRQRSSCTLHFQVS